MRPPPAQDRDASFSFRGYLFLFPGSDESLEFVEGQGTLLAVEESGDLPNVLVYDCKIKDLIRQQGGLFVALFEFCNFGLVDVVVEIVCPRLVDAFHFEDMYPSGDILHDEIRIGRHYCPVKVDK